MTKQRRAPLISLISATPVAIPPATAAFREVFPEATLWNLLDDRLLDDATSQGGVTEALVERMKRLIRHADTEGADGILLTCSMYGPVAEKLAAETSIPLHAPDSSAFQTALQGSYDRILILASAMGPLNDSVERFTRAVARSGKEVAVTGVVAAEAAAAACGGDDALLKETLWNACKQQGAGYDAVLLAQYSLSPAADALSAAIGKPVLAGPKLAAAALRSLLLPGSSHTNAKGKENA